MALDPSKRVLKKPSEVVNKEAEKPKEISMVELMKAQRKIDENNLEKGIKKQLLSRPRSKDKLPIANK